MKVQELRIGNFVQPNERQKSAYGNNPAVITLLQEDKFTVCNHYPGTWFEPIPITDEWLFRLGFIDGWLTIGSQEIYININLGQFNLHGYDSCTSGTCFCGYIKYVHQLQNLYFALTGNELTYE